MFALRFSGDGRCCAGRVIRVGIVALALAATGCAGSRTTDPYSTMGVGGPRGYASAQHRRVSPPQEMEADGMPGQAPPLRRKSPYPDDPSQPFSPNYGPPPLEKAEAWRPEGYVPDDIPAHFRRQLLAARAIRR